MVSAKRNSTKDRDVAAATNDPSFVSGIRRLSLGLVHRFPVQRRFPPPLFLSPRGDLPHAVLLHSCRSTGNVISFFVGNNRLLWASSLQVARRDHAAAFTGVIEGWIAGRIGW